MSDDTAANAPDRMLGIGRDRPSEHPVPVEDALEMPVLARIRPDRRVRGVIDRGHGPGRSRSLRRTAATVLDALGLEP